ncbi:hypothetical protein HRH25_09810 [Flavisolibacter sp. BT320]|nr:hypothetical protein [Flavisolibacter longurius]
MEIVFTICSNNYLAQANVLGCSVGKYEPASKFIVIIADKKSNEINYEDLPFDYLFIESIFSDPQSLVERFGVIGLNTNIKPIAFQYLLKQYDLETATYLDPDVKLFGSLALVKQGLREHDIILTPHIYTPIDMDGKSPSENTFLNFGLYNLGFIGLKNNANALHFLKWWQMQTLTVGFIDVANGYFVDQLCINHVPIFFKNVLIIDHVGYNMAPWNLHERYLTKDGNHYLVNKEVQLIFYHFSSFNFETIELPLHKFNRFTLKERNDLLDMYQRYRDELQKANFTFYRKIKCAYIVPRLEPVEEPNLWTRLAIRISQLIPETILNRMSFIISRSTQK